MRLFGGHAIHEGAPEVCIHGQWAYGCYQNWDKLESTLFCSQIQEHQNIRKFKKLSCILLMLVYLIGKFWSISQITVRIYFMEYLPF